jgi:hypothetical protein
MPLGNLKRFSVLLIGFLMVFFTVQPAKAAVLPWEPVVDATHGGGPGFGNPANDYVSSMATFGDYLYVATFNGNAGSEVWRTNDGTNWTQSGTANFGGPSAQGTTTLIVYKNKLFAFLSLAAPFGVVVFASSNGTTWGPPLKVDIAGNTDTFPMPVVAAVYNTHLYVSIPVPDGGGGSNGEIYASDDGITWNDTIGITGETVQAMVSFNNLLYIGTRDDNDGARVYNYDGHNTHMDNFSGFDGSNHNRAVVGLVAFNGELYATTENAITGAEIWRTPGDSTWEKVSNFDSGNGYGGVVFKDYLYVGMQGGKVFRTANGTSWEQVNEDAFGQNDINLLSFAVLGDYIYVGGGERAEETVKIYRYGMPTPTPTPILPQTGADSLNSYILDAIL